MEKTCLKEDSFSLEGPLPIENLVEKGINQGDIKKLKEAGFNTVESILFTAMKNLVTVKGLSENKLEKIMAACQSLRELGFQSALTYFEQRKSIVFISTGSKSLGKELFFK